MKCIKQDFNCLQLKSRGTGWAIIAFLAGLVFFFLSWQGLRSGEFNGQWLGIVLLMPGIIASLYALFGIELRLIYTFDKTLNVMSVHQHYALRTNVLKWRLQDICWVQVVAEEDSDRTTHYGVSLLLKSGEQILLRDIMLNPDREQVEWIAEQLREFLRL